MTTATDNHQQETRNEVCKAPPRSGSLAIHWFAAEGQETQTPIGDAPLTIGAGPRCDVRLPQPGLRPLYCVVTEREGIVTVRRWASDTLLNGQTFAERTLEEGDVLSVGGVELCVVRIETESSPLATEEPSPVPEDSPSPAAAQDGPSPEPSPEPEPEPEPEQANEESDRLRERNEQLQVSLHQTRRRAKRLVKALRVARAIAEVPPEEEEREEEPERYVEWPETDHLGEPTIEANDPAAAEQPAAEVDAVAAPAIEAQTPVGEPEPTEIGSIETAPEAQLVAEDSSSHVVEVAEVADPEDHATLESTEEIPEAVEPASDEAPSLLSEAPDEHTEAVAEQEPSEEPAEPFQEESFYERYAHMLPADGAHEDGATPAPAEIQPAPSPEPSPSASATEEEEEISIDHYMKQMLARMREDRDPAPEEALLSSLDQASSDDNRENETEEQAPEAPPLKSLDELPKAVAPESASHMTTLREVANTSANDAIQTSQAKRRREKAVVDLGLGAVGALASGAVIAFSSELQSAQSLCGLLGLLGSAYFLYESVQNRMAGRAKRTR